MSGLFDGLELGKKALATHQLWLNTIGHNIANVNTPGYSRQRVSIQASQPYENALGPIGTGVEAFRISNIRDLFLNQQYRDDNQSLGQWTAAEKTITQIEEVFSEPSDGSLSNLLNQFWSSWSDLANNQDADLNTLKNNLKVNANLLTSAMHRIHSQLSAISDNVDKDIELTVQKVNVITTEIASLNMKISNIELGDERANDLRDQRDYLLDELSEYVDSNAVEQSNGTVTVLIGAMTLVDQNRSFDLETYKARGNSSAVTEIVWQGTKVNINIVNGTIKGLTETRDEVIPKYLQALDDIAAALVTNVNSLHLTGYNSSGTTGTNFFDPNNRSAANIKLTDDILNESSNIASASTPDSPGDRTIALAISDLSTSKVLVGGTSTINDFYQSLIGNIGSESAKAQNLKSTLELVVAQLENSRQSVQGVSLDEEMTQMIKFQHAYDAAARVITTMDEALNTVINNMGLVGR
ncbi:MAG: flagellar hook-associated protein FlgK [Candidatus Zixiibacteriota bacterium]